MVEKKTRIELIIPGVNLNIRNKPKNLVSHSAASKAANSCFINIIKHWFLRDIQILQQYVKTKMYLLNIWAKHNQVEASELPSKLYTFIFQGTWQQKELNGWKKSTAEKWLWIVLLSPPRLLVKNCELNHASQVAKEVIQGYA